MSDVAAVAPGGSELLLELDRVERQYQDGAGAVRALDGVELRVAAGEYVTVTGRSGSGKSTLLNILGCLDRPTRGSYRLQGLEVQSLDDDRLAEVRSREIGFVFQTFNLLPRATAVDNVALPLLYQGVKRRERERRAAETLARVDLANQLHRRPNELSGGQAQRVAIARALVANPALILADEPTGNLDSQSSGQIFELFESLHRDGRTLIVVTHDATVADRAHRRIELLDGRIIRDAS